jgi:GntR family transcriptional regulator
MSSELQSARAAGDEVLGFRPLYRQVRDVLVKRIADGIWQAGQMLPSEPEIAGDLGVSQGTVRKALDEMAAENLVVRRQGRGTFVARHDDVRMRFRFFKLMPDRGERRFPDSRLMSATLRNDPEAAERLGLAQGEPVLLLERIRSFGPEPQIFERIHLPQALFPGMEAREFPNNLYEFYAAEFGITVARASERLKAVAAGGREAELLKIPSGTPLLRLDRLAYAIDGNCVEWRIAVCRTEQVHYHHDLR